MKNLLFNLTCAVCLAAASSASANTSFAESNSFRLITDSTIASRTVDGDRVYIASLDGCESVPLVDGVSLEKFAALKPRMYVNGGYSPMNDYLPAHAYWIHTDEEQTVELSGFMTK